MIRLPMTAVRRTAVVTEATVLRVVHEDGCTETKSGLMLDENNVANPKEASQIRQSLVLYQAGH